MFVLVTLLSIGIFAENIEVLSVSKHHALVKTGSIYHRLSVRQSGSDTVVVDTLFYYQPPRSNADYDDFLANYQSAGDTCINWFTLLAPGKVTKLMMQNSSSGKADWMVWAPAIDNGIYKFPGETGVIQLVPEEANAHYCTKLNESQQTMDSLLWNTYDLALEKGASVIEMDSSQLDFWVGYRLDDTGNPKIWQDGVYHYPWSEGDCRSFTTLQSQSSGKWYRNVQPGTDHWVAHMMQVEVVYNTIPPIISDLPDLCDTFSETRTIRAEVVELEGNGFDVYLTSKIGSTGSRDTLDMSYDGDNYFRANLDYSYGDTLYYYVWAKDSTGMLQSSEEKSFVCVEPPPDAHILLIDDSPLKTGDLYCTALDRRGFEYFFWNVKEHNGIDTTVILYDEFLTLILLDGESMILPVTAVNEQDIYQIAAFLDHGGNLLLVDMDYLYRWDLDGTGRFKAGDFAFDYLGIEDFTSDPDDDYNIENGGIADTSMVSVPGNPITSEFGADSIAYGPIIYQVNDSTIGNWADYIEPSNDAYSILTGRDSDNGMAVCIDTANHRTATFLFPIELASDTAEFFSLLDSTLSWLNENTTRLDTTINLIGSAEQQNIPAAFRLNQNYPNPFNPATTLSFELLSKEKITLTIYDVLGNQIDEIVDQEMKPGVYTFFWTAETNNGEMLPSGIYFYRLKTNSKNATGKMVLLR